MSSSGPHILETFDMALNKLHDRLLFMASLAERSLNNAMEGLFGRDDDLCSVVIADDDEIDALEKEIDFEGIDIIRRFQPVANDLRRVIATIKLNGNFERVADQATNIAKRARKLNRSTPLEESRMLEPMFHEAFGMFRDGVRAYAEENVELALAVKERDKALDKLNHDINDTIAGLMSRNTGRVQDYLNLLFVTRHLERVGDYMKYITEEVVYAVSAEDVRHTGAKNP